MFIGLTPNVDLVKDQGELDRWGFVKIDTALMTSLPGIFAAGGVRSGSTKQAASAVGKGATAASKGVLENGLIFPPSRSGVYTQPQNAECRMQNANGRR